jgi:hypothetical protein
MIRPIVLALLLTACATTQAPEPRIVVQEVRVPVDDPACAREARDRLRAEAPNYPDTDEALRRAASAFEGAQLLLAGRILRIAREAAIMGALEACAGRTAG